MILVAHFPGANEDLAFWKRRVYAPAFDASFRVVGGRKEEKRERNVRVL